MQHETLWKTLTMDHEEGGGGGGGGGGGIKRSENYLGKKLVTGDTPCHLILQATKICRQWSGNEASGCPFM